MKLADKVVVVTGGARGIGRSLCERFAREGPKGVVVADKDRQGAQHVADGIDGLAIGCDVAIETEIHDLVEQVQCQFGRIDLFCANAGIAVSGGVDLPNDQWRHVMDVNFMSHVYSSRAVLPAMLERGEGYLLHTASAAGLLTQIGSAPYAVSKHAAVSLAEWLAITYADRGVRVSCLCPQGVLTDMLEGTDPIVKSLRESAVSPEQVADAVVDGLEAERFLILPHPEVAQYLHNKSTDYDRWLGGMRKLQRKLGQMRMDS